MSAETISEDVITDVDKERWMFYCLSVFPDQNQSGFRQMGLMTTAQARAMMGPDDMLLTTQRGVDEITRMLNDPAEANKIFFLEVEGVEGSEDMATGSWGIRTLEPPSDRILKWHWMEFLQSHSRFKHHLILQGYTVDVARRMFQVLTPSEGSTKH